MTPHDDAPEDERQAVHSGLAAALAMAVAVLAVAGWMALDSGADIDGALREAVVTLRGWGRWGALGSMGLMVLHSFVPFPAEILSCANGLVWGPVIGAAITWVGAMLGAAAAYGLARRLGQPFVRRFLTRHQVVELSRWADRQGASTLLVSRLIPVIAFNLINYAAALAGIRWWTFLWTTGLGILPMTVLTAVLGDRMLRMPAWIWLAAGAVALSGALLTHRIRGHRRR